MRTRTWMLAAMAVALCGVGRNASAQMGTMGGPAAPYPAVMAPTYMQDSGVGPAMGGPQGPYAAPLFNPTSYAGMGGPAPMGAGPMPQSPMMTPMAGSPGMMGGSPGMPMGPGGDYAGDYGAGYGGYGD